MPKGFIFFICSCIILILSAINLSVGPIISGKVGYDSDLGGNWGTLNCLYLSDTYDDAIETKSRKEIKYDEEWKRDECYSKRAMYHMEYFSFIFDVCLGFICGLLSLLHLLEENKTKTFVNKTGLIGLICGAAGFVITFVYIVYNGIVYTSYYDYSNVVYKRDSEGAFAVRNGDKFECFYHDEPANKHSIIAKYSDLIKKQYNYDKDLIASYLSSGVTDCLEDPNICLKGKEIPDSGSACNYLYVGSALDTISNKDISDRFLTALILSLLVCLTSLVLAIFGLLLFLSPGETFVSAFETVQTKL